MSRDLTGQNGGLTTWPPQQICGSICSFILSFYLASDAGLLSSQGRLTGTGQMSWITWSLESSSRGIPRLVGLMRCGEAMCYKNKTSKISLVLSYPSHLFALLLPFFLSCWGNCRHRLAQLEDLVSLGEVKPLGTSPWGWTEGTASIRKHRELLVPTMCKRNRKTRTLGTGLCMRVDLRKKYDSIGPFLVKIEAGHLSCGNKFSKSEVKVVLRSRNMRLCEETTAGTKTGMAPSMAECAGKPSGGIQQLIRKLLPGTITIGNAVSSMPSRPCCCEAKPYQLTTKDSWISLCRFAYEAWVHSKPSSVRVSAKGLEFVWRLVALEKGSPKSSIFWYVLH